MNRYLRFGHIPKDKKSKVHKSDAVIREEKGVSVWECAFVNDVPFPLLPTSASESAMADYFYCLLGDKPVYLVEGTELAEKGSAGEPLLDTDISIIREYTNDYNYLKHILSMRDATEEERKSTRDYIDSISKPTGLQFDDIYEEIDLGE